MTLPFGVTTFGFVSKDLDTIRAELDEGLRAAFGNVNTAAGPFHQLREFWANRERTLWELAESTYAAPDPDMATGDSLDAVGAITDNDREAADESRVTLTLSLDATITVPAGSIVSVTGQPSVRFVTLADVTSTTAGDYPAEAECEETGPIAAAAGTLEVIETPVSGWTAVTNALDAVPGTDLETDPVYRARRRDEVARQGTGPADAIRADLLDLDDVVSVSVTLNDTDATVDGLPPHSFEAIVYDGSEAGTTVTAATIAQRIWDVKPAGIETYGNTSGTAVDALGIDRVVRFSRPVVRPVYLDVVASVHSSLGWNATTGPDAIKAAVVTEGRARFTTGKDVIRTRLFAPPLGVDGVHDVTALELGFTASPSGTINLAIAPRELATFDTSRVTVTANIVEPS